MSWWLRARMIGPDRALEGIDAGVGARARVDRTVSAPRLPVAHAASCARTATIEFGTLFSSASASIGERAYIGPRCHLGWAVIERRRRCSPPACTCRAARTRTASTTASIAIRDQPTAQDAGAHRRRRWIGSAAVVMADVGRDSVIAAGAVVTRPIPDLHDRRRRAGARVASVAIARIERTVGLRCASSSSPIACPTRPTAAIACARITCSMTCASAPRSSWCRSSTTMTKRRTSTRSSAS